MPAPDKNSPFFAELAPVNNGIVEAMVKTIPSHWSAALLKIENRAVENGAKLEVVLNVTNPDGVWGTANVTQDLINASVQLQGLLQKHNLRCTGIEYRIDRNKEKDNEWKCGVNFKYAQ